MTEEKTSQGAAEGIETGKAWGPRLMQGLCALLLLAVGVAIAVAFLKLKKPPERVEQAVLTPLVQVRQLDVADRQMVIEGYGTVTPKVEVDIIPEVGGKIIFVHSELKTGGVISAGEKIVQIDPSDYKLAVQQAQASVAEAQVRLDTEIAEAEVARKEWRQLHPEIEPDSPLVLREPQIRRAKAGLESAKAQLSVAELRLQRTAISLPFDVLIVSENVDLGQYVGMGQPLAKAYGTAAFEIEVPLEDDELAWFDVFGASMSPRANSGESDRAPAEVRASFAGGEHTWQAYVVRTTGQVDRMSRMVSVVVEVPQPLELSNGKPPLLPGAFVSVRIVGRTLHGAVAVPRDAIHGGNRVWLVEDDRLHIEELDIVRADKDFAYVTEGIPEGALIVVSSLDTVVEGMQIRVQDDAAEPNDPTNSEAPVAGTGGGT